MVMQTVSAVSPANIVAMINGVPINGMENQKVYWSNWQVCPTRNPGQTMQVRRRFGCVS